jgi:phage terminase large subunit-like protein
MPWQQQVLDVALEIDPATGKLAYREIVLTVPRQSGKTTLLLVLILLRALGSPLQNIRYTAQTGSDARKKWTDDWLPILDASPFSRFYRVRLTNGHEALRFNNGSLQALLATTLKAGHGGTLDLGILDEAFAHPDARLEQAVKPAMITRPQPQLWVVSTAGTAEKSPYLWGKVQIGRAAVDSGIGGSIAYFEWSASDDMDPADPETWWSCMPALGYTQTEEAIASDFASMPDLSEFERAYLNRWKTAMSDPVIPLATWLELVDERSVPRDPVCFAFDVSPDQSASIAAVGKRADGKLHGEIIDRAQGTAWLPERLAELVRQHRPVALVCDPVGPAGAVLAALEQRKVKVVTATAQEHARACGMLYNAAMEGNLRHLGDADLLTALDGAVKRQLGDAWAWSRRTSAVDISPLVAVTLALWGMETCRPKKKAGVINLAEALANAERANA